MRIKWLAWSAVDSVGGVILAFAVTVLFARVLEPADFGRFALALGLVQLASVVTEALLHDAVVQRLELEDAHAHTAVWTIAGLGVALMLLMLLGADRFANLAGDPSIAPLVGALALSIPLAGVSSVLTAQLRRALRFRAIAFATMGGRLAGIVGGVVVLVLEPSAWALVAQQLTGAIVIFLLLGSVAPRLGLVWRWQALRDLLPFGVATMLTNAGWMITGRVFIIQAGALFGTTALGHFNLALRFVDVLRDSLINVARRVALPVLSEQQHDRARFAQLYARYSEAAALVLVPVFAGICLTADLLVEVLLAPAWTPTAPLIRILTVGAMIGMLRLFAEVAVSAAGRPVFNLVNVALAFVVVNGSLALGGGLGIEAAAWCWIARHVLGFVATLVAIRAVIGLGPLAQMRIGLGPLAATLTMMAAVWTAETRLPGDWSAPARLAALVALGVSVYAAAASLVARGAIRTLLRRQSL